MASKSTSPCRAAWRRGWSPRRRRSGGVGKTLPTRSPVWATRHGNKIATGLISRRQTRGIAAREGNPRHQRSDRFRRSASRRRLGHQRRCPRRTAFRVGIRPESASLSSTITAKVVCGAISSAGMYERRSWQNWRMLPSSVSSATFAGSAASLGRQGRVVTAQPEADPEPSTLVLSGCEVE
jgi:hypothetical protein